MVHLHVLPAHVVTKPTTTKLLVLNAHLDLIHQMMVNVKVVQSLLIHQIMLHVHVVNVVLVLK